MIYFTFHDTTTIYRQSYHISSAHRHPTLGVYYFVARYAESLGYGHLFVVAPDALPLRDVANRFNDAYPVRCLELASTNPQYKAMLLAHSNFGPGVWESGYVTEDMFCQLSRRQAQTTIDTFDETMDRTFTYRRTGWDILYNRPGRNGPNMDDDEKEAQRARRLREHERQIKNENERIAQKRKIVI